MLCPSSRLIVVGDVHGCLVEFTELVSVLELTPNDTFVSVGDLVDKGPDPRGVVQWLMRHREHLVVKGNHDDKACRWHRHEARTRLDPKYKNPMQPRNDSQRKNTLEWASMAAEEFAFLEGLPLYARLAVGTDGRPLYGVHAGALPGRSVPAQSREALLMCRWVDDRGRFVGLGTRPDGRADLSQPAGTTLWPLRWDQPEHVVYGHVVQGNSIRHDVAPGGAHCFGVDTGCVHGGNLSATCWNILGRTVDDVPVVDVTDFEVVAVRARQKYAPNPLGLDVNLNP